MIDGKHAGWVKKSLRRRPGKKSESSIASREVMDPGLPLVDPTYTRLSSALDGLLGDAARGGDSSPPKVPNLLRMFMQLVL